jgi:hypothetical protein
MSRIGSSHFHSEEFYNNGDGEMSDIKQKFDPSTHMTRCGEEWEQLQIDLGRSMEMIIKSKEPKCSGDFILWIDDIGQARNRGGHRWESYDLIPITLKPVDLPTNLREEIKYAAMDDDGDWFSYSAKPKWLGKDWENGEYEFWDLRCISPVKDPAGPENSLHIRTESGWERVES